MAAPTWHGKYPQPLAILAGIGVIPLSPGSRDRRRGVPGLIPVFRAEVTPAGRNEVGPDKSRGPLRLPIPEPVRPGPVARLGGCVRRRLAFCAHERLTHHRLAHHRLAARPRAASGVEPPAG